ncbi:MAG: hypothetical protein M3317_14205, partial [Actinomycetota bacterium]|nr:hypothetical protein [Actinomycetota bacterium]
MDEEPKEGGVGMEARSTDEVTAEGTNAGGDEIGAAGAGDVNGVATKEANVTSIVAELVERARAAMSILADYDQEQVNEVVQAVGWAIIKQENAEELARIAVEDTGLGNYEDKVNKNQRKSLGTL